MPNAAPWQEKMIQKIVPSLPDEIIVIALSYLFRVPECIVIGKVHELVHQIGLVHIIGQRAQLFVS